MLSRISWTLLALAAWTALSIPQPAQSDGYCSQWGLDGKCLVYIDLGGGPGSTPSPAPGTGDNRCYRDDIEIPCVVDGGAWHPDRLCYVLKVEPQPPLTDPIWAGRQDGAIYSCRQGNINYLFWAPDAEPPDPEQLAQQLIAQINFQAIDIGTFPYTMEEKPEGYTLVGWHTWLWAKDPGPTTVGPITDSITQAGYTVSITAKVTAIDWNMGDGTTITCDEGTPFRKRTQNRNDKSPDCEHIYTQPGQYPVTATSRWHITWTGIGKTGTLTLNLSQTATFNVKELHTVNIPNPDQ